MGIVYGDIGTSPLYAFQVCFDGPHSVGISEANILGVLSLIVWSLILVISIKYLTIVMRADNDGEGGILALLAIVTSDSEKRSGKASKWLILTGLFGASLLYGDGMITPAISVLSAVEGLKIATPKVEPFIT
ncbi:MAG: KUP/HAK/KT family potassium transporter, partial [Pirellulales bacterium]